MERQVLKFVLVGNLAAEVEVTLVYTDDAWAPYLSAEDAARLDEVRLALQAGDVAKARQLAQHVYCLIPLVA